MAAFGLRLPDPQAGPALTLAGTAIAAAALADFLLGVGTELGLPSRAVVFVALTAAAFVLAEISLRIAGPAAPRLLIPSGLACSAPLWSASWPDDAPPCSRHASPRQGHSMPCPCHPSTLDFPACRVPPTWCRGSSVVDSS